MTEAVTGPASGPAKTVFLHVGCRKSGTSALQQALRESAAILDQHGLGQPMLRRAALQRRLVEPVRRSLGGDGQVPNALRRLADQIHSSPAPRHLVSLEALAEWEPEATGLVLRALSDFDLHVVITARPWAMVIPSEWQQRVKSRYTGSYPDWTAAIRDPGPVPADLAAEARAFHLRQDVADVARRWGAGSGRVRTHVILVPPADSSPDLRDLFCDVVGADPGHVTLPERIINPSLSYDNAELLRRVNVALGDRLTDLQGDYRTSVRRWIAVSAMMNQEGHRIPLPREHESWATEQRERQLRELKELDCEIVGDETAHLHPELPGPDFVPPTGEQLAQTAAAVLAELAEKHDRELREAAAQARQEASSAEEQEPPAPEPLPLDEPSGSAVRRTAGRVRRRVRQRVGKGRRARKT